MVLKFSRGIWFVSILAVLATCLFVYASLPEDVIVLQDGLDYLHASRESFFYVSLVVVTLINSLVFLVGALFEKDQALRIWFNGLMAILNIFFIVSFLLISAINSNEKFKYADIGFMIYGSVALIAVWAVGWPVWVLIRKISGKQPI
jgi:hypothetical protein